MQLDNLIEKKYKGSFHCFIDLIKNYGISSLYTGKFFFF